MEIYGVKISIIGKEEVEELCLHIDPNKRNRIEKFINEEDKIRSLIGEILIRTIVFQKLNITFQKNQYGKPCLKWNPKFHFNISHYGDFVDKVYRYL